MIGSSRSAALHIIICMCATVKTASGSIYQKQCPLSDPTTLALNPTTGGYQFIDASSDGDKIQAKRCPCALVRTYCIMSNPAADTCGIPRDPSVPVGCFSLSTRTLFIRNAWPVVVLWYGALAIFLLVTENGRNARNYVLARCFPQRNQLIADQIVRREVEIRDRLRAARIESIRRARRRLRRALASFRGEDFDSSDEYESEMVLKTRVYDMAKERMKRKKDDDGCGMDVEQGGIATPDTILTPVSSSTGAGPLSTTDGILAPPNGDNILPKDADLLAPSDHFYDESEEQEDDEEDRTCIICMTTVDDGDKIGALPCDHLFHSDCLKQWIRRRNVCPLCQEPDIACWRRTRRERTNDDGVNDSDDSSREGGEDRTEIFNTAIRRSQRRTRRRNGAEFITTTGNGNQSGESTLFNTASRSRPTSGRSRVRRITGSTLTSPPNTRRRNRGDTSAAATGRLFDVLSG